jgi:hypothetical protein
MGGTIMTREGRVMKMQTVFLLTAVSAFVLVVTVRLPNIQHVARASAGVGATNDGAARLLASAAKAMGSSKTVAATSLTPAPVAQVDVYRALDTLNTAIGEDGRPVERAEIEQALQTDPELRDALLN